MNEAAIVAAQIGGTFVSTFAAIYVGIKASLNGIKERTERIESLTRDVRDATRDTNHSVGQLQAVFECHDERLEKHDDHVAQLAGTIRQLIRDTGTRAR